MSVIGDIFGAGGVASLAETIINKFVPDPQAKEAALEAMRKDAITLQQMQNDLETKLNETAGQNIRADAASGDKFTERARPMFMYIIEFVLAFNFIGLPIAQIFGSKIAPLVLPPDLLVLFGTCVTGYVFARTADKIAAMPGDSNVSVLGVIKASNKS